LEKKREHPRFDAEKGSKSTGVGSTPGTQFRGSIRGKKFPNKLGGRGVGEKGKVFEILRNAGSRSKLLGMIKRTPSF